MPSRCWLTLKAPPLSLNNYASIYIYLFWSATNASDGSATESTLGLVKASLGKELIQSLRIRAEDEPLGETQKPSRSAAEVPGKLLKLFTNAK